MTTPISNSRHPVMLVDDDATIHQTVGLILEAAGYQVVPAFNGKECLEHLRRGFRGVVLMDVMMPQLDGWDTIRAMARDNLLEGIGICMLTAVLEPGAQADGLQEYILDYLPKPFTAPQLLEMVASTCKYLPA